MSIDFTKNLLYKSILQLSILSLYKVWLHLVVPMLLILFRSSLICEHHNPLPWVLPIKQVPAVYLIHKGKHIHRHQFTDILIWRIIEEQLVSHGDFHSRNLQFLPELFEESLLKKDWRKILCPPLQVQRSSQHSPWRIPSGCLIRHGVCFRRLFYIFCYHIPHRRNDILSGRTEKSPHVLFRTHNPTGNYFSVYSRCLPIAPAPNTASAHKGIGTDPNVNHRVPKFLFSTIYPIVSHSYLYYLTCAFLINDSITETTFLFHSVVLFPYLYWSSIS